MTSRKVSLCEREKERVKERDRERDREGGNGTTESSERNFFLSSSLNLQIN